MLPKLKQYNITSFLSFSGGVQWCIGRACLHTHLWSRVGVQRHWVWGGTYLGLPLPHGVMCCPCLPPLRLSLCPGGLPAYLVGPYSKNTSLSDMFVSHHLSICEVFFLLLLLPLIIYFPLSRCVMPCIQACHTCLPCVRSIWISIVNIFIMPFCESVSRCCNGIYVSLSKDWHNVMGGIIWTMISIVLNMARKFFGPEEQKELD